MLPEREGFLEVIRATAARAAAGNGKVVVVQGEAGIGKTSLLRAFAAQQGRRGRILWGWCEALFVPRPLGPVHDMAASLGPRRVPARGSKVLATGPSRAPSRR